jgi:hypothetical protein
LADPGADQQTGDGTDDYIGNASTPAMQQKSGTISGYTGSFIMFRARMCKYTSGGFGAGNGDTIGVIVSNQASMNGNGNFRFDLSLANTLTTSSWQVTKWREFFTATDRAIFADKLNF